MEGKPLCFIHFLGVVASLLQTIMDHDDDDYDATANNNNNNDAVAEEIEMSTKDTPPPLASVTKSRKRAHPGDSASLSHPTHNENESNPGAATSLSSSSYLPSSTSLSPPSSLLTQHGTTVTWDNNGMDAILTFPCLKNNNEQGSEGNTSSSGTGGGAAGADNKSLSSSRIQCCLVGRARLTCLGEGRIEILGYQLGRKTTESTSGTASSTMDNNDNESTTPMHVDVDGDVNVEVDVVSAPWSSFITVVQTSSLSSLSSSVPTQLKVSSLRPPPMDHSVKQAHEPETMIRPTFQLLDPTDPMARPTVLPPSWIQAVDKIVHEWGRKQSTNRLGTTQQHQQQQPTPTLQTRQRTRVALCGAKGVGKSTCLRYTANKLLSSGMFDQVAILDADVGQPELSPPGLLTLSIIRRPLLHPPHLNVMMAPQSSLPHEEPSKHEDGSLAPTTTPTSATTPAIPTTPTMIASIYFGAITYKVDPTRYMECIQYLIQQYEQQVVPHGDESSIPLLINMDGWIKGLGYEVLTALLSNTLYPSHIIQLVGETRAKIFDLQEIIGTMTVDPPPILHVVDAFHNDHDNLSMTGTTHLSGIATTTTSDSGHGPEDDTVSHGPPYTAQADYYGPAASGSSNPAATTTTAMTVTPWTIPAASLRTIRLGSYFVPDINLWDRLLLENFDDRLHQGWMDDECAIAHILAAERPYCVPFESVNFYLIGTNREDVVSEDMVLKALNASIVGLCCGSPARNEVKGATSSSVAENNDKIGNDDGGDTSQDDSFPASPTREDVCLGLGLIRSIDTQNRLFYILTPVCPTLLPKVTSLVGGNIETPLQFHFRGCHAESFPYLTIRDHSHKSSQNKPIGSDPMQSRNNISRRGNNAQTG